MTNLTPCPNCNTKMFFSPDGRFRTCERCGHKETIAKERQTPQELAQTQVVSGNDVAGFIQIRDSGVRDLLHQGVASVQSGNMGAAFHYLTWVLRTDSSYEIQAKAWLWLSQVYDEPQDKRFCLEQVLAINPQHGVAKRGLAMINGNFKQEEFNNSCPNCNTRMFFSPDGRFCVCERCGHKEAIVKERQTPQELAQTQVMSAGDGKGFIHVRDAGVRQLLGQGIAAVKSGDMDEAFHYLTWVLRTDASHEHQAKAWLWLSQVYTENLDKRYCLEQTLAINPQHGVAKRGLAVIDGRLKQEDIVDPNKLEREVKNTPEETQAEQFICPNCAGHMNYAPDGQSLLCEFCRYEQEVDEDGRPKPQFGQGDFEQDFTAAIATAKGHLEPIYMRTFQCHGCAIDFVLPPETLSVTCPYCDSVYVTESAESHEIMPPHALIPFSLSEDDARRVMRQWARKHKIERPRVTPFVGIYLPVWTFDVGGDINWSGQVQRNDDWVFKSGIHILFYDDVLVPGSNKLPNHLVHGFDEFDLEKLVAYDARYLADWPAERYQIPLADASLVGRKRVLRELRSKPRKLAGEYVQGLRLNSMGMVVESFKLILLPVWIVHYKVEGEVYDVVINGQNGMIHGDRPQSGIRKFFGRLLGQ